MTEFYAPVPQSRASKDKASSSNDDDGQGGAAAQDQSDTVQQQSLPSQSSHSDGRFEPRAGDSALRTDRTL